ncbi:MAG: LPS-assembly lipoprotein LptE [Burkholderiales bacterium]
MSWFELRVPPPALRLALTAALCVALAGCGFQLRGSAKLPFNTLYVEAPQFSLFATQLRRVIGSGSETRVTNNQAEADATLQVVAELREKEILSLSAGGRARELQLRYRVRYLVYDKLKRPIVEPGEIILSRDYSFDDQNQVPGEGEEVLLYRDMQTDAVQQLVRRLQAAAKAAPGKS